MNELMKTYEFLDTLDIKGKYLKPRTNLDVIMEAIEEDWGSSVEDDDYFEGIVFNWMTVEEFGDYLSIRYKEIPIHQEVIYEYRTGIYEA